MEDPADENLDSFFLVRDRADLFPLMKGANAAAGTPLKLLLSPWSPPAFMKTNGEMNHGGRLKPEYYGRWASCIAQADGRGGIRRNGSYWYIGHFSRFVRPGAVRVELSRWCAELEATPFQNVDGNLAVVALNRSSRPPRWICTDTLLTTGSVR